MNLTSGLSKQYKRSFILDEDALRRFHAVLDKSSKDLSFPTRIVFRVEREDDRYYETTEVDDVLSDPNILGKRVNVLSIELRPEIADKKTNVTHVIWQVMVLYSLREKDRPFPNPDLVHIRIATQDRNWARLVADELESQVQRTFKAKATPRWLLALCLLVVLVVVCCWSFSLTPPAARGALIPRAAELAGLVGILSGIIAMFGYMSFRLSHGPTWFLRAFGPESAFLWGEESQSYPNRGQTRRNIQWCVLVAFLVSVIAGLIVAIGPFLKNRTQAGLSTDNHIEATK